MSSSMTNLRNRLSIYCRFYLLRTCRCRVTDIDQVPYRTAFFSRKTKEEEISEETALEQLDNESTSLSSKLLSSHSFSSERIPKVYQPPADLNERMAAVIEETCGPVEDWQAVSLKDSSVKFKVLSMFITEFNHNISNSDLTQMSTAADALAYFSQPVNVATSYEELSQQGDLPRNLHIQMEPIRFDPETDTMFGGVTAFPGRPTIVTSLKYRHKYKGTDVSQTLPLGYEPAPEEN